MLVFPVWLTKRGRGRLGQVVRWATLLGLLGSSVLSGVAYGLRTELSQLSPAQGSLHAQEVRRLGTLVVWGAEMSLVACLQLWSSYDVSEPVGGTGGTLRLTRMLTTKLAALESLAVLSYALREQVGVAGERGRVRAYLGRAFRAYAAHAAPPSLIAEVNRLQQHYACCGLRPPDDRATHPSLVWLQLSPANQRPSLPWSCCKGSKYNGSWEYCQHEWPERAGHESLQQADCGEAVLGRWAERRGLLSGLLLALGLWGLGRALLARYVTTSLWAAVWWSLDRERSGPGFLFQLDLLRSRYQPPAYLLASEAAKARRRVRKLRRINAFAAPHHIGHH